MHDRPELVSHALWTINNIILEPDREFLLTMVNNDELFPYIIELFNYSNDASVHLNALNFVNNFIAEGSDDLVIGHTRRYHGIITGLVRRGLISCS